MATGKWGSRPVRGLRTQGGDAEKKNQQPQNMNPVSISKIQEHTHTFSLTHPYSHAFALNNRYAASILQYACTCMRLGLREKEKIKL